MCGLKTLFALLFVGLGLLQVISPRLGWYLSEGWKLKDAEPSDAALVLGRVAGVVLMAAGLFVLLVGE